MSRRVTIIANPIAGGGRAVDVAPELARQLEARGIRGVVRMTQRSGDARDFAGAIEPDTDYAVVVIGGDGTVNEVLNGLPDPRTRLSTLPLGTANVLAAELALPADPARCAAVVDHGREVHAAIGLASVGTGEPRRFLLFAGVGIDGQMVKRLEEVRRGPLGKHRWLGPVLHVVWHWPIRSIRIETAEGQRLDGLSEVLVTRVRNYGGVFSLTEGIDIEDGLLHVLGFRQQSRFRYLLAAFRAWRGTLRPGRDVEVLRTTGLRIDAEAPTPCQVDGDGGGQTPIRISIDPRRARILAPPL